MSSRALLIELSKPHLRTIEIRLAIVGIELDRGSQVGERISGADGEDLVLPVPEGTVVVGLDGEVIADLTGDGTRWVIAPGGSGGLCMRSKRCNRNSIMQPCEVSGTSISCLTVSTL